MMYKSPISLYELDVFTDTLKEREEQTIGAVLRTVQKIGVSVDKEELLRALSYDRNQYLMGYMEGNEDAQPKWVSVEEKQPEAGKWALVYCGGYANWFDLNKWCGNCWLKVMPVTHWMSLPEPPKEVEGDG